MLTEILCIVVELVCLNGFAHSEMVQPKKHNLGCGIVKIDSLFLILFCDFS